MSRYKPLGWRQESIRHSLAAKGLTKRFSYAYVRVHNSGKGNFSDPSGPKTPEGKDLLKSLQARGYKTTGGREARRKGDVISEGQPEVLSNIPGSSSLDSDITQIPTQLSANISGVSDDTMPTVSAPERPTVLDVKQQAQQVEGGPQELGSPPLPTLEPIGVTPQSFNLVERQEFAEGEVMPEIDYGESREGLLNIPELATPGVPSVDTTMESDRL